MIYDKIIGIDPGKLGGICIYDPFIKTYSFHRMPILDKKLDIVQLRRLLQLHEKQAGMAVIEWAHAFPSQGVTSVFSFGEIYGQLQGLCIGLGYDIVLIAPQLWQKCFDYGDDVIGDKKKRKKKSIEIAKKKSKTADKLTDGMAEAYLILEAYRKHQKKFLKYRTTNYIV